MTKSHFAARIKQNRLLPQKEKSRPEKVSRFLTQISHVDSRVITYVPDLGFVGILAFPSSELESGGPLLKEVLSPWGDTPHVGRMPCFRTWGSHETQGLCSKSRKN